MAFVEVRDLGKSYGTSWALRHATIDVERGEIVGVVGENGAGKTTLLKMLAGILAPSEGMATVAGQDIGASEHRSRTGYLPEESALYDEMTPASYLRFFADVYGVPRAVGQGRIERALHGLGLAPDTQKRIGDLSKGNKRKVAIARSLVNDPDFLVYDEPASGLDPIVSAHVLDVVRDAARAGKAVILSAHNLFHVERVCDRVLLLRRGAILAWGTLPEIREKLGGTRYAVRTTVQVQGSVPSEAGFETIVEDLLASKEIEAAAIARGGRVIEVRAKDLSLEEIFLRGG